MLIATDLPEPVVPAISICGVRQIDDDGFAADVLAEAERQLGMRLVLAVSNSRK